MFRCAISGILYAGFREMTHENASTFMAFDLAVFS